MKPLDEFAPKRGKCRPCQSLTRRERYEANLEKTRQEHNQWYERNKVKVSERRKAAYRSNPAIRADNLERSRQWRAKPENKEHMAEYRRQRRNHIRLTARAWQRLNRYGLTAEDYERLLEKNDGCCHICMTRPTEGSVLDVDHCHATGRVRGLLCQKCNKAIGLFADDPIVIEKAAHYVRAQVMP